MTKAMTQAALIEVSDLFVAFGHGRQRIEAVKSVSFAVAPGGSFGLVGESGSGKTTVLRALAGLIENWRGRVALAGRPVGHRRSLEERKLVQMVFQDPYGSLHPRHTVDRALAEPAAIHGLDRVEERIRRVLREVGLGPEHRFRYPHQLSGGQRQRVAIARALILEPPILLLDEPTSALDVSVQAEILNLLRRLRAEHGLTMLMVSHNLAVVAWMCEHLAVMNRGEVVEMLAATQIRAGRLSHPYTQALFRASAGYDRTLLDASA
jgi:peptide/nickel transport system ATP-binding protein